MSAADDQEPITHNIYHFPCRELLPTHWADLVDQRVMWHVDDATLPDNEKRRNLVTRVLGAGVKGLYGSYTHIAMRDAAAALGGAVSGASLGLFAQLLRGGGIDLRDAARCAAAGAGLGLLEAHATTQYVLVPEEYRRFIGGEGGNGTKHVWRPYPLLKVYELQPDGSERPLQLKGDEPQP